MRSALLLTLAAAGCALACGDRANDDADPARLVVHPGSFLAEEQPLVMLGDGDAVRIQVAVQGGWVIYIGAQVEHLAAELAELHTRLVDPETGAVRQEDSRTVVMRPVPGNPALKQPDLRSRSQVSHLLVCPNAGALDIVGREWLLDVRVAAIDGSVSGRTELRVTPTCALADEPTRTRCQCECAADYVFGKCD